MYPSGLLAHLENEGKFIAPHPMAAEDEDEISKAFALPPHSPDNGDQMVSLPNLLVM